MCYLFSPSLYLWQRIFVQSDGGGELIGHAMKLIFNREIVHRISCLGTPEQSGVAECNYSYAVETRLTLLVQSNLASLFLDSCIGRGCNPNLIRWVLDYFIIFLVWKDHLPRGFFLLKLNMLSTFFNLIVWMDLNMSHSYCWFSIKQR